MNFFLGHSRVKRIAAAALGFACAGLLVWTLARALPHQTTNWEGVTGY